MFINDTFPRANQLFTLKRTSIKSGASIGTGAILMSGITIGHNAMMGAGAVVTHDVADNETVIGVQARSASASRKWSLLLSTQALPEAKAPESLTAH